MAASTLVQMAERCFLSSNGEEEEDFDELADDQEEEFEKRPATKKQRRSTTTTCSPPKNTTTTSKLMAIPKDRQAELLLAEWELKDKQRRVSHSAIERRRREKINERFTQLRTLIPTCAHRDDLHKLSVLEHAIDHINHLKSVIENKTGSSAVVTGGVSTTVASSSCSESIRAVVIHPPPAPLIQSHHHHHHHHQQHQQQPQQQHIQHHVHAHPHHSQAPATVRVMAHPIYHQHPHPQHMHHQIHQSTPSIIAHQQPKCHGPCCINKPNKLPSGNILVQVIEQRHPCPSPAPTNTTSSPPLNPTTSIRAPSIDHILKSEDHHQQPQTISPTLPPTTTATATQRIQLPPLKTSINMALLPMSSMSSPLSTTTPPASRQGSPSFTVTSCIGASGAQQQQQQHMQYAQGQRFVSGLAASSAAIPRQPVR
ncbi:hypothetical protein HDU97_001263 [Phlyctochytrium planicorne]|nr:hypothetical protein HDU97_001263 [Phlyctochytrium planicorne]